VAKDIVIVVCSIILTGFIVMLFIKSVKIMFESIADTPDRKRHKYNADDFYDEPDGFYVTMADGSVRIDD